MKSIAEPRRRLHRLPLLALLLAGLPLLFWACHLKEPARETVLSLGALADTLDDYDTVLVVLRDAATGDSLETIFRGKVSGREDLVDLPTSDYKEGRIVIAITGWKDGQLAYHVERVYDGRKVEELLPLVVPSAKVEVAASEVEIDVGADAALPAVTVTPAELADKTVLWESSHPEFVSLSGSRYRGEKEGSALLTAKLKADPSRRAGFTVRVKARVLGSAPDSLRIRPDTLVVALKGRAQGFALEVFPASAERSVTWHGAEVNIARVSSTGQVEAVGPGLMRAWAVSAADRGVADTAWVRVTGETAVEKVDIVKDVVHLVRGGTAESLTVKVEPFLADPAVELRSRNDKVAAVEGLQILGVGVGETWVDAVSRKDDSKRDSVRVVVGEPRRIDSVTLDRDTLLLWVGGPGRALKATVHPANGPTELAWSSSDAEKAGVDSAGLVTPGKAGNAVIRAVSRHDTTRRDEVVVTVRADVPRLNINEDDTTVAVQTLVTFRPAATQDFGTIVHFEWDLDGDGALDGTSESLKDVGYTYPEAKTYSARFLVRDSEGNSAQVIKRVRAVTGRVVDISAPRDRSITRERVVDVAWTVDGEQQSAGLKDTLKVQGPNVIRRSAKDQAGNEYLDSITVFWDTVPPAKPLLKGSVPAGARNVTWSWSSGGNGGHGLFRSRIDTADLSAMPERKDTLRAATLPDGSHTLFVQERDSAGNWSETASLAVTVDATPPGAPVVTTKAAVTNQSPHWGWKSGGQGSGTFRWSLDSNALAAATPGTDTTFTGGASLADGVHTLYVQERDAAGNWSVKGSLAVRLDRVKPAAPVFPAGLLSPMNLRTAAWAWASGGGGNGTYRYSLDVNNPSEETRTPRFALPSGLPEGNHTLYVQERDTAGNWSETASRTLYMAIRDTVGTPAFSGGTRSLDFAFSPGGVAHVALSDEGQDGRVSVLTFSGGTWTPHPGTEIGFPRTSAWPIGSLSFNGSAPMVSYQNGQFVSVKTYTSGSWRFLGDSIIAVQSTVGPVVANGTGKYYALAVDGRSGTVMIDTLMGSWGATSTTGLTAGYSDTSDYRGSLPDMDLAPNGTVYVAFRDRADRYRTKVLTRGSAGSWNNISTGLPADSANTVSMAIGPDNTPYLVISASSKLSAWVYRNGAWSALGNLGALGGGPMAALAIGAAGVPYVAHPTLAESNRVAVRAYVNNAWTTVARGLSPAGAQQVRIAVQPTGDVPWVAYTVPANGRKITVVKAAYEPPAP